MKSLKEKMSEVSTYLQSLMAPNIFPEVRQAVEKKDKNLIIKVCRKANVPERYLGTMSSVLLSVSPQQKWPEPF